MSYRPLVNVVPRDELDKLMGHLGRMPPGTCPMQKIIAFAIFSTRRQEEITLLRWEDLDGDRVLVRAIGNELNSPTPSLALQIAEGCPGFAAVYTWRQLWRNIFPSLAETLSVGVGE